MNNSKIIIFILVLFASCGVNKKDTPASSLQIPIVTEKDTSSRIQIVYRSYSDRDSLVEQCKKYNNRNIKLTDSIEILRAKVEKARYYLNICIRNPTQDKFLKGWMARALQ